MVSEGCYIIFMVIIFRGWDWSCRFCSNFAANLGPAKCYGDSNQQAYDIYEKFHGNMEPKPPTKPQKWWLVMEIIPKWRYFRLVNYYNYKLPRYIVCVFISVAQENFRSLLLAPAPGSIRHYTAAWKQWKQIHSPTACTHYLYLYIYPMWEGAIRS